IGYGQHLLTLLRRQGMAGHGARGRRALVAGLQPFTGLPALQRAHIDACDPAGDSQARTGAMGRVDALGYLAAIFQEDHSSSPLGKIASSFFDSTSSAAVSASALSLRRRS